MYCSIIGVMRASAGSAAGGAMSERVSMGRTLADAACRFMGGGRFAHSASDPARSLLHELHPAHGFEVLEVDLVAVGLRQRQAVENLQRLAHIHRAAFRIERAVGGE